MARSNNLGSNHDPAPNHSSTDVHRVPERLGDVLVRHGAISQTQRDELVEQQSRSGRPTGLLAEELFDVPATEVERAWAAQYAAMAERVGAADIKPEARVRELISARQAWQFRVLPMKIERGALVVLTSEKHLIRAHKFAFRTLSASAGQPIRVVLCDEFALFDALERYYRMDGAREFIASAA